MGAKKHDFKRLDVERAQISVSIADARDIVTQWLGADFDEDEGGTSEASLGALPSATAGLGSKTPAPVPSSKALDKLKREQAHQSRAHKPAPAPRPRRGSGTESESESESESRTSTVKGRAKRPPASVLDAYKKGKRLKKRR